HEVGNDEGQIAQKPAQPITHLSKKREMESGVLEKPVAKVTTRDQKEAVDSEKQMTFEELQGMARNNPAWQSLLNVRPIGVTLDGMREEEEAMLRADRTRAEAGLPIDTTTPLMAELMRLAAATSSSFSQASSTPNGFLNLQSSAQSIAVLPASHTGSFLLDEQPSCSHSSSSSSRASTAPLLNPMDVFPMYQAQAEFEAVQLAAKKQRDSIEKSRAQPRPSRNSSHSKSKRAKRMLTDIASSMSDGDAALDCSTIASTSSSPFPYHLSSNP
ncbi:hypothetical protein PFISCL1PPCAC_1021, partial [Pristionchus fissidentatus]